MEVDSARFSLEAKHFDFNGKQYDYYLSFGSSGLNERIVEVPIVWEYVSKMAGKKVLEVGRVMAALTWNDFDVVDLTEKAPGVINVDILDYHTDKRYDLIICISTLEHIGFGDYGDAIDHDPEKSLKAINHMISLLDSGGTLIATAPIGWNPFFDELIVQKKLPFTEIYFMKRKSRGKWYQTDYLKAINTRYGWPQAYAQSIIVGIYKK